MTRSDSIHICEMTERHCAQKEEPQRGIHTEGLYTNVGRVGPDKIQTESSRYTQERHWKCQVGEVHVVEGYTWRRGRVTHKRRIK